MPVTVLDISSETKPNLVQSIALKEGGTYFLEVVDGGQRGSRVNLALIRSWTLM